MFTPEFWGGELSKFQALLKSSKTDYFDGDFFFFNQKKLLMMITTNNCKKKKIKQTTVKMDPGELMPG